IASVRFIAQRRRLLIRGGLIDELVVSNRRDTIPWVGVSPASARLSRWYPMPVFFVFLWRISDCAVIYFQNPLSLGHKQCVFELFSGVIQMGNRPPSPLPLRLSKTL